MEDKRVVELFWQRSPRAVPSFPKNEWTTLSRFLPRLTPPVKNG